MKAKHRDISMGFTSDKFPEGTHMCFIYRDERERRETIAKFLESGMASNEKVWYFAAKGSPAEMEEHLADFGIHVPSGLKQGQFTVKPARDIYTPDRTFIPQRMLDTLKSAYAGGMAEGYAGVRGSGEMEWALEHMPGSERLIEYEALINTLVDEHPLTAVCQYDANKFDGATLFEVLNVHPAMIIRGQVVYNPYYLPPDKYFKTHVRR